MQIVESVTARETLLYFGVTKKEKDAKLRTVHEKVNFTVMKMVRMFLGFFSPLMIIKRNEILL